MTKKLLTLCLIHEQPRILLGLKKRGFATGRWNGFGGKVEPGESIEAAARRELFEETSIEALEIKKVGHIEFEFVGQEEILDLHFFRIHSYQGEPQESEEMRPQWFHVDELPYAEMWPDDLHWMPLFLAGKKFTGHFLFQDHDTILNVDLREVDHLDFV